MSLVNFSSSVCNYTTKVVELAATPGSLATNTYPYVDLEMIPDAGYYLNPSDFTYLSTTYVDYVVFMTDGNNLKARVYLNGFTWPSERTDLEVPISGCATKIIPVVPTPTPTPTPTPAPVPTPPACPAVTGYFVNKSIIELRGETRIFKVYGQEGAEFSYTVIDNDNGFSLTAGTKTIPYAGFVNIELIVPLTTSARVFDVTITTAEQCTLQLQTQPSTFKLYQGIDEKWEGDTFECCEEAGVLLSTNCVGYDLYGTYTDGQCSTTNSLIETNSTTCGYTPPPPPPTPPTPPPPTPPTPPAPEPVGSYDCNSVTWATASFNCSTGAISVTANYGSTTIHSYSPTTATPNSGVVTITYTFSDADPAWDNTGTQITCTNLSVDTTCTPTPPPPPAATWDCVNGSCVERNDGSGAYSSLSDCQANCSTPPAATWDCVNGSCVERNDGSGVYSSLSDCQANCSTPPPPTPEPCPTCTQYNIINLSDDFKQFSYTDCTSGSTLGISLSFNGDSQVICSCTYPQLQFGDANYNIQDQGVC